MPARAKTLTVRYDPTCGPSDEAYTDVNDIIACYNYLQSLGTTQCTYTSGIAATMCTAGSARVDGYSLDHHQSSAYW